MPDNPQESPAEKAERLLGAKKIAGACDLTTNAVWKWRSQGGGRIPAKHQSAVLQLAKTMGAPLTAQDLIGEMG